MNTVQHASRSALPAHGRATLAVVALLATAVVIGLGVALRGGNAPEGMDRWLDRALAGPTALATPVDFGGEPAGAAILVTVLVVLCLLFRRPRHAVLAVACLIPPAATTALKPVFDRTIHGAHLAYPSGHTAFATALGFTLALLLVSLLRLHAPAATALLLALATVSGAAMAWAEITLDAHYPTDTLGGYATALALMPPAAWLLDRATGTLPAFSRFAEKKPATSRDPPQE